jgi:hypothetical protein
LSLSHDVRTGIGRGVDVVGLVAIERRAKDVFSVWRSSTLFGSLRVSDDPDRTVDDLAVVDQRTLDACELDAIGVQGAATRVRLRGMARAIILTLSPAL